jgi:flagellar hook-associated protein 1 FlgK
MGIPKIFNTGRTGLMASRAQLATTGHNIANLNTEGYSRQRVDQETNPPASGPGGDTIGTGTRVSNVDRIHNKYLESQIRSQEQRVGYSKERDVSLTETVEIFNEANSEGLNKILARFFNSWRQLSNEPENESLRTVVRSTSSEVVKDFHRINRQLLDASKSIDHKVEGHIKKINNLSKHISELNGSIRELQVTGGEAADLKDQRDLALRELSSLVHISTATNENGEFTVNIKEIGTIVEGVFSNELVARSTPADDKGKIEGATDIWLKGAARPKITHKLEGGKLGGLLEVRDDVISNSLDRMNELAQRLVEEVNYVHKQGVGRDGVRGRDFFKPLDSKERAAELIDITDAVKNSNAAVSASLMPGKSHDNRVALAIASLQEKPVFGEGRADFDQYYNALVSDLAVQANKSTLDLDHQKGIMTQLEKFKSSISGVSLDEETANLIQHQHAFDASARVIKTADELLVEILNLKR